MGGGIGVEDVEVFTEDLCKDIAGCNFDTALFGKLANQDGKITRDAFMRAISKRVDVAFLHDVDADLDTGLKMKLSIIDKTLQQMGLRTWIDNGVLDERNPAKRFKDGIDNAQCAVVLLTKNYSNRVGADSKINLAQEVFNYCADRKTNARMVAVVLDSELLSTRVWRGEVGLVLGRKPFIDMTGDLTDQEYVHAQCELLYRNITQKVGKTVQQFTAELGQLMPDKIRAAATEQEEKIRSGPSKPLQQLTVHDVSMLLTALNMGIYVNDAAAKLVDGECLHVVEHYDELKEMGISMTAKAKILFNRLTEFKVYGVPLAYLKDDAEVSAGSSEVKPPLHHMHTGGSPMKSDLSRDVSGIRPPLHFSTSRSGNDADDNRSRESNTAASDTILVAVHQHALSRCFKDTPWECDGVHSPDGCYGGLTTSSEQNQTVGWQRWRCSEGCDYDLCGSCVDAHNNLATTASLSKIVVGSG